MSNLPPQNMPNKPNFSPLPEGGGSTEDHVEKKTIPGLSKGQIESAAKEGRAFIKSGELSTQVIESLAAKFGPKFIVEKMSSLLGATKTMAISGMPFETPDFKTQLDALKVLLQYQVGMPVARTESVVHNVDTMQTLEAKMQNSPALRRAVGRMLDQSKIAEGELVDVTERPLSESEEKEAERALQELPVHEDTPVEREVLKREMGAMLRSRTEVDLEEKYTR